MINALFWYRIARKLYEWKIPLIPKLLRLFIFVIYGSMIPYTAKIGKGTFCAHGGLGVVIHDNAVIGQNCIIGLGSKIVGKKPYKNAAKIGDNVRIGPGAVIVGPVIIENNAVIAPNAVVVKSIKEGLIVGGVPAKVIGHVDQLEYDPMKGEAFKDEFAEFVS